MSQHLPADIKSISSPLILFCGDNTLSEFIADSFFRDGSTHYNIKIYDESLFTKKSVSLKQDKNQAEHIFKGSWYYKHSNIYPALCLFCINVDVDQYNQDRSNWLQMVKNKFDEVSNLYPKRKPVVLSLFVCPGNRETLAHGNVREDGLIRDLNALAVNHIHSFLFYEDDLSNPSFGNVKSMKAEIYQICHNYYSERLDLLDMHSAQPNIPPEQTIKTMLKMSFFNECLSSLNLQESNRIYAYTRCLEYYSRVQDYCISLFSDVQIHCNEEIMQILSVVNYKVILFTLQIQQAKGIHSLTKKIARCIHALSVILQSDASALFSLWKATQYQFILDEFAKLEQQPLTEEIQLALQTCYLDRLYYTREAYIHSIEYALSKALFLVVEEHQEDNDLFLALASFPNAEAYRKAIMDQNDFRAMYLACYQFNREHGMLQQIPELIQVFDKMLIEMKLISIDEESKWIQHLFQTRAYSVLKQLLFVISSVCYSQSIRSKLIHTLLILLSPRFSLQTQSRLSFYNFCRSSMNEMTAIHQEQLFLPFEWDILTQSLRVYSNETVSVQLVLQNPFPSPVTVQDVIWMDETISVHQLIQPLQKVNIPLTCPAHQIHSLPPISLQLCEFPVSFQLSPHMQILSNTKWDLDHISPHQVQVLSSQYPTCVNPSKEQVIIGMKNQIDLPLFYSQWARVQLSITSPLNDKLSYPQHIDQPQSIIPLTIDLSDPAGCYSTNETLQLTLQTAHHLQTTQIELLFNHPFTVDITCVPTQSVYYAFYPIPTHINLKCNLDTLEVVAMRFVESQQAHVKETSVELPKRLQLNESMTWSFNLFTEASFTGVLSDCQFVIDYRINDQLLHQTVSLPSLQLLPPPLLYSIEFESPFIKGTPSSGVVCITNHSDCLQVVNCCLNRELARWVVNGVLECDYTILPGESVKHPFSLIPLQSGSQEISPVCITIPAMDLRLDSFVPTTHVFVKDSFSFVFPVFMNKQNKRKVSQRKDKGI